MSGKQKKEKTYPLESLLGYSKEQQSRLVTYDELPVEIPKSDLVSMRIKNESFSVERVTEVDGKLEVLVDGKEKIVKVDKKQLFRIWL